MKSASSAAIRDRLRHASHRVALLIEPAATGLPNWRVVSWFPTLVVIVVAVLVILQLGGTSSGMHWLALGTGDDPRLVFGSPRAIRSDEWLVQQSWVVSQSNTGFLGTNLLFPGGMDMTVFSEIPSWDWSTVFRPHLWGYLLFGLGVGAAWFWWAPAVLLIVSAYLFVVSLSPRRPVTAALVASALYFTPMLQWFYTPSSLVPTAWGLLAMAGVVWVIRDRRRWVRWVWSAVVGYFAVTLAMGLYVPFILPVIFVFLAFAVGYALNTRPVGERAAHFWARISPLLVAGVLAVAVAVVWVATRWSTFEAVQSTVYPGQRIVRTGSIFDVDPALGGLAGAPWDRVLGRTGETILGPNSSEASGVILIAVFLLPALIWLIVERWRSAQRVDWVAALVLAVMVIFAAYLFIPGWDALAHLLLLDRVPAERVKYVLIVLGVVTTAIVVQRVDLVRPPRKVAIASAALTAVIMAAMVVVISSDVEVRSLRSLWPVTVMLVIVAVYLLLSRRTVLVAALLLAITAVILGSSVNPVYRGLFDLSETAIGEEVSEVDAAEEGTWVGVGSYEPMAILTQVGVESLSGVQNYPSDEMWDEIDPTAKFEKNWNRLAHVQWKLGVGSVTMANPSPDVVAVTFDPCSSFAQDNIDYVLADADLSGTACLAPLDTVTQGASKLRIYEIAAPR